MYLVLGRVHMSYREKALFLLKSFSLFSSIDLIKTQKTLDGVLSLLKSNNINACTYLNTLSLFLFHALASYISLLNLRLPLLNKY